MKTSKLSPALTAISLQPKYLDSHQIRLSLILFKFKIKSMQRYITSIAFCVLSVCAAFGTINDTFSIDGISYQVLTENQETNEVAIMDLDLNTPGASQQPAKSLIFPSTVTYAGTHYNVVMLYSSILCDIPGIEEVILPSTIRGGLTYNFCMMHDLRRVVINGNIENIHASFIDLPKLEEITLPASLIDLSASFCNCGLTNISFPPNLYTVEASFRKLPSLEEIDLGNVSVIEFDTFTDLPALTSLTIPSTIKALYGRSFQNLSGLESLTLKEISDPSPTIDGNIFLYCGNLKQIIVENHIPPTIGRNFSEDGTSYHPSFGGHADSDGAIDKATCRLLVPPGRAEAYKANPGWSEFKHIEEYNFGSTPYLSLSSEDFNLKDHVSICQGRVVLSDMQGRPISIYGIDGKIFYHDKTTYSGEVHLPEGIYIMKSQEMFMKFRIGQ